MKRALKVLLAVCLAAVAGLAIRTWGIATERIYGTSMEDTLLSGDVALVLRPMGEIERGDVVVCRFANRPGAYVKRVVGLPGETLVFEGGTLFVDGAAVAEPYVSSPTEDMTVVLGDDEYFVLGDNRQDSYDSRSEDMGPVSRGDLLGRVRWVLWPLARFGRVS